jgi:hypothetical protein
MSKKFDEQEASILNGRTITLGLAFLIALGWIVLSILSH